MDLFSALLDHPINLLPYDGEVNYFGEIMPSDDSDYYFNRLLNDIDWRCDQAMIFGKRIETKRKVAWYASESFRYTYSKVTKTALPFSPELLYLKALVERHSGETYNSCLLNLYHTGEEGMAWHSDGEKDLQRPRCYCFIQFWCRTKVRF